MLVLAACGGVEPLPDVEPAARVSLLVRDPGLALATCRDKEAVAPQAKLEISGVLGVCRVSLKADGSALSLCDEVPGREPREVVLTYFHRQKQTELELLTVETFVDLTDETRDTVEIDFGDAERVMHDDDADGTSSFDELCAGRDPRDPNR